MGSCVSMLNKATKSKGSSTPLPPRPLSYEQIVLEQNEENRNEGYVAIPMEEKLPIINDGINEPQGENSSSDDNNGAVDGHQVGKLMDSVAHDHEVEKSVKPIGEEEEKEVVIEATVNHGRTTTT